MFVHILFSLGYFYTASLGHRINRSAARRLEEKQSAQRRQAWAQKEQERAWVAQKGLGKVVRKAGAWRIFGCLMICCWDDFGYYVFTKLTIDKYSVTKRLERQCLYGNSFFWRTMYIYIYGNYVLTSGTTATATLRPWGCWDADAVSLQW